MQMMHWYNPKTRMNEEVAAPMSDAQAIELLSGHPDSDEFIEEYRHWREATGRGGGPHPHGPGVPLGTREGAASKLTPRCPVLQQLAICFVRILLSVLDDGGEANGNCL